jgi:hypothetical protein
MSPPWQAAASSPTASSSVQALPILITQVPTPKSRQW